MELILFPTEQLTNASYPSLEIGGKWVWVPHEEKCILHLPRMPIQSSDDFSCMLPCYYGACNQPLIQSCSYRASTTSHPSAPDTSHA
jgi:hypothetical protein